MYIYIYIYIYTYMLGIVIVIIIIISSSSDIATSICMFAMVNIIILILKDWGHTESCTPRSLVEHTYVV